MAYYDLVWYCNAGDQSTTGHYAVAKRPQNAAVAAGQLVRQFTAPAVNSERVFVCIIAGTTANTTDATWVLTRGAKTTDNTVTWMEVSGIAAVNGDVTNTVNWAAAKAIGTPTLGTVIKRANAASYWICTTAGTMGASEPAWPNDTAGTTQADGTTTWTCLGVVGAFTGGQAPHARIPNAATLNWFAAGNTIYVGDNHAESQTTAITIGPTLTVATVSKIICHNHSGSYPPASSDLRTTATISTTAAVNINISHNTGSMYFYGIAFKAGVGVSAGLANIVLGTVNAWTYFDACSLQLASTLPGTSSIWFGNTNNVVYYILNNTTVFFGATQDRIDPSQCILVWQNTGQILASGSAVPSVLFLSSSNGQQPTVILEALDLSQINTTITNYGPWVMGAITIKDCKLNASVIIGTTALGQTVQVVRSDSGATAYKSARYQYEGTETTETSITRVGGASDPTGQAQSRKIVTTANSQWLMPFKAEPYAIWNPRTAANVTVTVCGTINAGALPNNDDIWLEVEYLGDNSTPYSAVTSYSNDGGQGDRTGSISISTTLSAGGGTVSQLIDGSQANSYWWTNGQTSKTMTFDFGVARVIDEFTWYQDSTNTHGSNQTFAGSNDNISYTNLSTTVALGSSAATVVSFTNTTAYRYYRLTVPGSTSSGPFLREITFKIDKLAAGGTPLGTIVTTTKANVLAANVAVASDSSTWNGGGSGAGWSPFKLVAVLSSPQPGLAGYLHARVRAAKPSSTYYIDPQITLS